MAAREVSADVEAAFEGLAIEGGQEAEAVAPASDTLLGAIAAVTPGTDLRLSAGFIAQCANYRCVRIAVIGDVHPQLAYNRYLDSDIHPPGETRFDVEAKYIRCEGVDLLSYMLAQESVEDADWVVLRTLGSDFLQISQKQILQLVPQLSCHWLKSEHEIQEARITYLKSLIVKYVAAVTYIFQYSNARFGRVTPVAVVLPSLGDAVKFNSLSRRTADMDLENHNKNLISSFYQLLGLFQSMWRARSKITLVHEKQVSSTCGCDELFPKSDSWGQFHSDALFVNTKGMGKLLRAVCVRLASKPGRALDTALFNDIDFVQGQIDSEVASIRKRVINYRAQSPMLEPRHTGWGLDVDTTFIMGGCVSCFDRLLKETKTEKGRQTVNAAVDRIVSSGYWLTEENLRR